MARVLFTHANEQTTLRDYYRPLWPAYLAAYVDQERGEGAHDFKFLENDQEIETEIASYKPDIVAIGSTSSNYNRAMEIARIAKSAGIPVIVGGIHITYAPYSFTKDMDVGVFGEGEQTFLELIECFDAKGEFAATDLSKIDGVLYHDQGHVLSTGAREMIRPLDNIPKPKRSLVGYQDREYMFTSRGCPYDCSFCVSAKFWDKVRWSSPERVMDELRELMDHGAEVIHFFDDLFTANKKRLKAVSEMIIAEGMHTQATFICYARAKNVTPEIAQMLKAMNVESVGIGLESGCDRTLQYLKGNVTLQDNYDAVNMMKDEGIRVLANFIIGSPQETEEEIMETYRFIQKSRLDSIDVAMLVPFPGTPVWEAAKAKRNRHRGYGLEPVEQR